VDDVFHFANDNPVHVQKFSIHRISRFMLRSNELMIVLPPG